MINKIDKLYDAINKIYSIRTFLTKNKYKEIVAIRYEYFEPIECEFGSQIVCKDKYKDKKYIKNIMKKSKFRIENDNVFDSKIGEIKEFEPLKWDRIIYDTDDEVTDVGDNTVSFIFKNGMKYKITDYSIEKELNGMELIYNFVYENDGYEKVND